MVFLSKSTVIEADGHKVYYFGEGTIECYKNEVLHRDDDKPVVIWVDGAKAWFKNGIHHRENNPSFIDERNCIFEYHLNNLRYRTKEYWVRLLLLEY